MKRKIGTIYDIKGQEVYVDFKDLASDEMPALFTALVIENDALAEAKVNRLVITLEEFLEGTKVKAVVHKKDDAQYIKANMEAWAKENGMIKKIQGPIVEIVFKNTELKELPNIYDALLVNRPNGLHLFLEVQAHLGDGCLRAIALDSTDGLGRGIAVIDTGGPIKVPVGATGRLFNVLGVPIDGRGTKVNMKGMQEIISEPPEYCKLNPERAVLPTFIKVVDLVAPFPLGGKIGFFGGAGVGKTVFLKELINTLIVKQKIFSIFCGIGERTREGSEDWEDFKDDKELLENLVFVFGQMNETSGIRFRAGQTAITMAEYFRDVEKRNVLVFIDNIFRYVQAGSEVSTLLGRMPSAVGYQPTLEMELGDIQERISSTENGAITAVEAVYVPADDLTDPAPAAIFAHLDASLVLKREIAEKGIYPAVDPLDSASRLLDPAVTENPKYPDQFLNRPDSEDQKLAFTEYSEGLLRKLMNCHYKIAKKVREILEMNKGLENTINLLGEEELKQEDKEVHWRATRIQKFFSQPFVVSEQFSGIDGVQVPIWETLYGFLCLTCDNIKPIIEANEDDFWNKGPITDVDVYGKTVRDKKATLERLLPIIQLTT